MKRLGMNIALCFAVAGICAAMLQLHAAPTPGLPLIDTPPNACEVTGGYSLDGDTIRASYINLPWGVTLRDETVRALDYDAWESSRVRFNEKTTDLELAKGKAAEKYLNELRAKGRLFLVEGKRRRDSYGRLLARFIVVLPSGEAINVGGAMKDAGMVRE